MKTAARHLGISLLLTTAVTSAVAHDGPDFPGRDDGTSRLFTVPFDISTVGFKPASEVRAKLTLKRPAILESYLGYCIGDASYGVLEFDQGPKGANGTTVVPYDAGSGAELRTDPLFTQQLLDFQKAPPGAFIDFSLPPTHVGVPVKADVTVGIFPVPGQSLRCQIVLTFRAID